MQTIFWEVQHLSCVKVRRHCKKCRGKSEFVSTGRFRLNANKKKLDAWLVYRCALCGTTWNLPIYERAERGRLPGETLKALTQNDAALAEQYAMDTARLARHGCETQPPDYRITGPGLPAGRPVRLIIESGSPLKVPVARLLRLRLSLSARALETLVANSGIRLAGGQPLGRRPLGQKAELIIHLPPEAAPEAGAEKPPDQTSIAVPGGLQVFPPGRRVKVKTPRLAAAKATSCRRPDFGPECHCPTPAISYKKQTERMCHHAYHSLCLLN